MLGKLQIKVLCVDDHPFIAEGLQARLSNVNDIAVVGRLSSAEDVVPEAQKTHADVVLMDIEMPGRDPFEAIDDLRRQCPDTKVILLSAYVRDHYIDSAVNAGAWGYLCKTDDPDLIIDAIRNVHRGQFVFGPEVVSRSAMDKSGRPSKSTVKPESKLQSLSPREEQVLRMIGKGLTRMQIAEAICRSPKTVDAHRASIMEKMGIHDRVELARFAIREGLAEA